MCVWQSVPQGQVLEQYGHLVFLFPAETRHLRKDFTWRASQKSAQLRKHVNGIIRHNVVTSQKGYMGGRKIILTDNMLYSIQNVERIPSWMSQGAKICVFVRICLLRCLKLQTIVSLPNIAFSSIKVVLSASGVNTHRSSTIYMWKPFKTNILVDFDVRGQQGMDFCIGGSIIMDYVQVFCPEAVVRGC